MAIEKAGEVLESAHNEPDFTETAITYLGTLKELKANLT